jgi:hypothetical protein
VNGRRSLKSRWKAEAFRTALVSDSVRAVLLLLSDHMGADGYVSVPRSKLAEELGRSPRRVTERLQAAVDAGLLARVSRGYEGHTAVYRALLPTPERVSKTSTLSGCGRVHPPFIHSVRERPSLGGADGGPAKTKETSAFVYRLRSERRAVKPAATAAVLYASLPALQAATSTRPKTRASAAEQGP